MSELAVVAMVALVVVGPQKLPGMLRSVGEWVGKMRRMTMEMRAQSGIDQILREEGIDGVRELRSLLRGEAAAARHAVQMKHDTMPEPDVSAEYPIEGADVAGALPDDLVPAASARAEEQAPEEEHSEPLAEAPGSPAVVATEEVDPSNAPV